MLPLLQITKGKFLKVINSTTNTKINFGTPYDEFLKNINEDIGEIYILILEEVGFAPSYNIDDYQELSEGLHNIGQANLKSMDEFYNYMKNVIKKHYLG